MVLYGLPVVRELLKGDSIQETRDVPFLDGHVPDEDEAVSLKIQEPLEQGILIAHYLSVSGKAE